LNSRNSSDCEIKNNFKKYCEVLADVIKLAKKIRYNNVLVNSSNKTKTTWNIINENINKRPQKNDMSFPNVNGTITHSSQVIANTFNTHFLAVTQHIHTENFTNSYSGVSENNPLNHLYNVFKQPIPSIKLEFVSPKEIEDVVSSLKIKESRGYDKISTKILKQSIPYISSPLTYICNLIISTGIFPTRLKCVEIKPLYKKGDLANITNYRPISLLTSFSNIFENIIYTRRIHPLNYNHILDDEQFSFRTNSSMDLTSYKPINDKLTSLNNKLLVGGFFCDLQKKKAFDCVDHDLLLSKMHWYGISGKGCNLIKSYLKNRYQRVIIANKSRQ
jgi:hypothetical protein